MIRPSAVERCICNKLQWYYLAAELPQLITEMHSVAWWPTVVALLLATFFDIRSRRIPNWLVLPFLVGGVLISGFTRRWPGIEQSLLGILLAAVLMGVLYWLGGTGMGDVKLCAAIGAWIGPQQLAVALVVMGVAGGLMALAWGLFGGFLAESLDGASDLIFGLRKRGFRPHETLVLANPRTRKMPYAPAIAVGTLFSFLTVAK